ncbi:hypothetical protein PAHAL_2G221400 [Panicum hallii]|uniref:Uncharacterized protein n=1 Tax=Panicum hallii TaxID=206008 RepID=A0A2T8KQ07_9POAL|nr:hypothetical protein PAHAL_2G221400 [Panicum hallii]
MSGCPSFIVQCDFGFCCGCDSDPECQPPPPPPPPPQPSYTEVITVVNAPMLPAHPHIPHNQPPPPLAEPHQPPEAPMPATMAYDKPALPQTIPRQCVPFADEVYNSPLPVPRQPKPPKVPSKRYETPALSMVPTQAPAPAANVDPPALHQGPLEPSRDPILSMEYYSQEQHQE